MRNSDNPLALALAGLMTAVVLAVITFARKLMYKALGDKAGRIVEFIVILCLFGGMIYAIKQVGND